MSFLYQFSQITYCMRKSNFSINEVADRNALFLAECSTIYCTIVHYLSFVYESSPTFQKAEKMMMENLLMRGPWEKQSTKLVLEKCACCYDWFKAGCQANRMAILIASSKSISKIYFETVLFSI